jgi:hypothetical protein
MRLFTNALGLSFNFANKMNTSKDLLEAYLQAKDRNRPAVIIDCYTPDAVLTYSIATDTIAFPAKVIGSAAIAQTLVRDFRKNFDCCKTYYVCDSLTQNAHDINFLPWLVIMRQVSTAALRLGKGWYRWGIKSSRAGLRVCAMHIHIERMDIIEDADGDRLHALQDALPYPWLPPAVLGDTFGRLREQNPALGFIEEFQVPVLSSD